MYLLYFTALGDCIDEAVVFVKNNDQDTLDYAQGEAENNLVGGSGVELARIIELDDDASFELRDVRMNHAYVG